MVRWYCDRCEKLFVNGRPRYHDVEFYNCTTYDDIDDVILKDEVLLCKDCLTEFKKWVNKVT